MTRDIKGKVQDLYNELSCANQSVKDVIASLQSCSHSTNLTEKVGIHARQMPEFKILVEPRVHCLSIIRQVCTGEMPVEKALKLFQEAEKQLKAALDCFNEEKLKNV